MTLEDVKNKMRLHAGQIKAWALHYDTFLVIVGELGIEGIAPSPTFTMEPRPRPTHVKLFDIPVVFVEQDQPEGIIL